MPSRCAKSQCNDIYWKETSSSRKTSTVLKSRKFTWCDLSRSSFWLTFASALAAGYLWKTSCTSIVFANAGKRMWPSQTWFVVVDCSHCTKHLQVFCCLLSAKGSVLHRMFICVGKYNGYASWAILAKQSSTNNSRVRWNLKPSRSYAPTKPSYSQTSWIFPWSTNETIAESTDSAGKSPSLFTMVRTFAQLCPRCGCVVLFTLAVGLFPFIAFCQGKTFSCWFKYRNDFLSIQQRLWLLWRCLQLFLCLKFWSYKKCWASQNVHVVKLGCIKQCVILFWLFTFCYFAVVVVWK